MPRQTTSYMAKVRTIPIQLKPSPTGNCHNHSKFIFPRFKRGSNISGGGGVGLLSRGGGGVQMLFSIETYRNCYFPGRGSRPPIPPSHTTVSEIAIRINGCVSLASPGVSRLSAGHRLYKHHSRHTSPKLYAVLRLYFIRCRTTSGVPNIVG